ncbi:predicted protein [Plenodomus lingam JN3]|uniref:Predicted protein n=1 Tax=Leptosphaeria maculans (strain JN3 / isolate v23.1.3 / race Av1-4-5-6-7-8) TaxID=985895 RepID=E4ZLX1_LEPMJ|nr:predicted protein [Plenodomus lingam JN3]CBX92801.1 predicted protein [Plenodomus lingam JN3]
MYWEQVATPTYRRVHVLLPRFRVAQVHSTAASFPAIFPGSRGTSPFLLLEYSHQPLVFGPMAQHETTPRGQSCVIRQDQSAKVWKCQIS